MAFAVNGPADGGDAAVDDDVVDDVVSDDGDAEQTIIKEINVT